MVFKERFTSWVLAHTYLCLQYSGDWGTKVIRLRSAPSVLSKASPNQLQRETLDTAASKALTVSKDPLLLAPKSLVLPHVELWGGAPG